MSDFDLEAARKLVLQFCQHLEQEARIEVTIDGNVHVLGHLPHHMMLQVALALQKHYPDLDFRIVWQGPEEA